MRIPENWPKHFFVFVPLLILLVNGVLLIGESLQPDTEKAIRLVRESNSRKENFTVQQYLYTTVYHRKRNGAEISIEGWRATPSTQPGGAIRVEFSYTDSLGQHVSTWEAYLKDKRVTPKNGSALQLSWH